MFLLAVGGNGHRRDRRRGGDVALLDLSLADRSGGLLPDFARADGVRGAHLHRDVEGCAENLLGNRDRFALSQRGGQLAPAALGGCEDNIDTSQIGEELARLLGTAGHSLQRLVHHRLPVGRRQLDVGLVGVEDEGRLLDKRADGLALLDVGLELLGTGLQHVLGIGGRKRGRGSPLDPVLHLAGHLVQVGGEAVTHTLLREVHDADQSLGDNGGWANKHLVFFVREVGQDGARDTGTSAGGVHTFNLGDGVVDWGQEVSALLVGGHAVQQCTAQISARNSILIHVQKGVVVVTAGLWLPGGLALVGKDVLEHKGQEDVDARALDRELTGAVVCRFHQGGHAFGRDLGAELGSLVRTRVHLFFFLGTDGESCSRGGLRFATWKETGVYAR